MKISALLMRFRYWLLALLAVLGFWSPWERVGGAHSNSDLGTTWLFLAGGLARSRILPIAYASTAVMGVAILLAILAAMLRTWAAAHRDAAQNAQYLGLWLNLLALSILMPPSGALFVVGLATVVVAVSIATGNGGLSGIRREPARAAEGERPVWGYAFLREIYFWGVAITYMALASRYKVTALEQGVLVSLGVAVVLQGLLRPAARNH